MDGVEAPAFDVFGTVVDWRSSVKQELNALATKPPSVRFNHVPTRNGCGLITNTLTSSTHPDLFSPRTVPYRLKHAGLGLGRVCTGMEDGVRHLHVRTVPASCYHVFDASSTQSY